MSDQAELPVKAHDYMRKKLEVAKKCKEEDRAGKKHHNEIQRWQRKIEVWAHLLSGTNPKVQLYRGQQETLDIAVHLLSEKEASECFWESLQLATFVNSCK